MTFKIKPTIGAESRRWVVQLTATALLLCGMNASAQDGNRLQDILIGQFETGKTGNKILADALAQAKREGITPSIYTHPIGYHGHAAGPTIGMWDHQEGVPGRGDYELFEDTCYSIELNAEKAVPEWDGQEVLVGLEEEAVLSGGSVRWLSGRQTEFHIIG